MLSDCSLGMHFFRIPVGECHATLAVDFVSVRPAPLLEGFGLEISANRLVSLSAELAFAVLGSGLPVGIPGRQLVAVEHEGLDLGEVLFCVPDQANYRNRVVHGKPLGKG